MAAHQLGASTLARLAGAATRRARWVLGGWVLVAVALNIVVPQLERVVAHDSTPFVPSSAPAVQAFSRMDRAFGSGGGQAIGFVTITADRRLTDPAVTSWYDALARRLHADAAARDHVADLQDWATQPQLRAALTSTDGTATYLPVALRHPVGSPQADRDIAWLRTEAARDRPAGVATHVTGDPATVTDLNTGIQHSIARVTVVTLVVIVAILLLLYRSLLLPLVPLATIGVALLTARGLVAAMGQSFLPVSTYTGTFLTALVLGAGTDYTVFLISRHHEAMRAGAAADDAVVASVRRIGPVIAASGLTVILGSACMVAARLALFSTTGPAIAVAVAVTLVVGLTFTPALLALLGDRAGPRERRSDTRSTTRWTRVGALVAAHPARLAVASVVLLAALAALAPTLHASYDTRALQPARSDSHAGYAALSTHFPPGEVDPDYVVLTSRHDLRTSRDLAVLDQVAAALTKVPGVRSVRGVTRPQGVPIPQAQLTSQLAQVGNRLDDAHDRLAAGAPQVDRLTTGADQLASGAGQVSTGAGQAADAVQKFLAGLAAERAGLGEAASGARDAHSGAVQLRDGAAALAEAMQQAHDSTRSAVDGLGQIETALSADPVCTADPVCAASRTQLNRIYVGERDQLLPGLARAADSARRISRGDGSLASGLTSLQHGLTQAQTGMTTLLHGEQTFRSKLVQLAGGAQQLASGAAQLPPGVSSLQSATSQLQRGLRDAASYLTSTAATARRAGVTAFYLPPQALDDPRLDAARTYYLSADGRTARYLVTSRSEAADPAAEAATVQQALRRTPLAAATVAVTGPHAVEDDLRDIVHGDFRLVALVTLSAVFLILVLLLRALVAPVYLLASVVLSYAAALGLTTLLFADVLHDPIDFTVPLLAFVILVAVGADYNILLMSRVREESERTTRAGVARAVAATGGVITSAGLIFAGTFIAMTTSPVIGLAETGFAVAAGLVLDTFVVRSLLVPSLAALLGQASWWPAVSSRRAAGTPG